jgi:hypothetical protein
VSQELSKWSLKSRVYAVREEWEIGLKEVSEQAGRALNEVKSEEDANAALDNNE